MLLISAPVFSPSWYAAPPNNHIQKWIISGRIAIEMLFSSQIFTKNIKILNSGIINFASKTNSKQTFECLFSWKFQCRRERRQWITVCYYHVTYAFQSESTLYSCLNVKKLLTAMAFEPRTSFWTHLVRKQTLNHLSKLAYGWMFL